MVDEIDHVDGECRYCGADFVAMGPDEVRSHMVNDHDDVLAKVFVWPTDEEKENQERLIASAGEESAPEEQSGTKQKRICDDCTKGFIARGDVICCPYCGGNNVR